METKICSCCGVEKLLNENFFYRNNTSKIGFSITCIECVKIKSKDRSKKIYSGEIIRTSKELNNKICRVCKQEKSICNFGKKKENKDGYRNECKSCRKDYEYTWKKQNPSNVKNNAKKYRDKVESKENRREYSRIYMRQKIANNLLFKLKDRISNRLREACKKQGFTKRSKTSKYVGCDWEVLKKHIEDKFLTGMNWENYGKNGWHIDHIIPISSAKTEEEMYKLSHYTNLQPLWWWDNLRKSDKISEEWGNG